MFSCFDYQLPQTVKRELRFVQFTAKTYNHWKNQKDGKPVARNSRHCRCCSGLAKDRRSPNREPPSLVSPEQDGSQEAHSPPVDGGQALDTPDLLEQPEASRPQDVGLQESAVTAVSPSLAPADGMGEDGSADGVDESSSSLEQSDDAASDVIVVSKPSTGRVRYSITKPGPREPSKMTSAAGASQKASRASTKLLGKRTRCRSKQQPPQTHRKEVLPATRIGRTRYRPYRHRDEGY